MTDETDYFTRSEGWALDSRASDARGRRTAWLVAGAALGIAALEAVAIAIMLPLQTTMPIALLVDRQTGFVETVDPREPRKLAADAALTKSLLAQYVTARENFDRATVRSDYRKVGLWSVGPARKSYLSTMPVANPASPLNAYPAGATVAVEVKSVSRYAPGTALVRFDTQVQNRSGQSQPPQPWISIVRYSFSNAPMTFEDRLVNPLGLQVSSYRRDAEAPIAREASLATPGTSPANSAPMTVTDRYGQQFQAVAADARQRGRTVAPVVEASGR